MDKDRERALAKRIGAAIAAQRKAVRMTQESLAEKLNCGVEAVSRLERGAIMPTLPRLIETAEALGCPSNALLGFTSDLASDQALSMTRQLKQVSTEDRVLLLNLLETLVNRLGKAPKTTQEPVQNARCDQT